LCEECKLCELCELCGQRECERERTARRQRFSFLSTQG
jgi:hypothetical protein